MGWFKTLALVQKREWFQTHREAYEALWLNPMKALLSELHAPLEKLYGYPLAPGKIFRLNRDVRFSRDKSPYKTNIAALISLPGSKAPMDGAAALYLHLGLEETLAMGFYRLDGAKLRRYRKAVVDDRTGKPLARLVESAEKRGLVVGSLESLKRAPPGVPVDHPRIQLLRHKGLALSAERIPAKVRFGAQLRPWILDQVKAALPVLRWGFQQKL